MIAQPPKILDFIGFTHCSQLHEIDNLWLFEKRSDFSENLYYTPLSHLSACTVGAFHLVCTQFYMLSGPTHPLFACNTQWKCIGGLTPPPSPGPLGVYVLNGRPRSINDRLL